MPAPTELVRGIDELIRTGLQNFRDSYFHWLLVVTGVVALGLMLEGPEVIYDFRPREPEHRAPDWIRNLALLGWFLIVVGFAGELVVEERVSKADGTLQTFNNILLGEAQVESARAIERAHGAPLEQERLRSENLRLEALIQPRPLSPDQERNIGVALLGFKGRKVVISWVPNEEAYFFTTQLIAALKAAKIDVEARPPATNGRWYPTYTTGVQVSWPPGQKDLGIALGQALEKIGHVRNLSVMPESEPSRAVSEPVYITVLSKPFDVLR